MTKKYGVANTRECVLKFKVGKANVTCRFTNGNLQLREPIPASYTTGNPIIQHVIESCDKFKNGQIFVISAYGEPEEAKTTEDTKKEVPAKKSVKKVKKDVKVMEEVTTHGLAVTALMAEGGCNMKDLGTIESCLAKAEEIGISFPNLK